MGDPLDTPVIEPLSPRLRALVRALSADPDILVQRVLDIINAGIPDYTLSADAALQQQLRATIVLHLKIWYGCLLAAQPPDEKILAPVAAAARPRVHQGVSLASMLRAFRIGSREFWVRLLAAAGDDAELHDELLFKLSPYLLHHFDVIAQTVAQAYVDEQFQHVRWRDRLRLEIWNVISARPDDTEAFHRHANTLGFDAWSPHCAVVLRLVNAAGVERMLENAVNRLLPRVSECFGVPAEQLMRMLHREHLVLWLPMQQGETLVDTDRRLAGQTDNLLARSQAATEAGIGLPGSGARGWGLSMDQAFRALGSGSVSARAGARRYSEILFVDVASMSDNIQRYLDAMIERLSAEPQLLETLKVYLELRQHRKAVAHALNVHPNTLDNRLQRIETLLGGSFNDVSWLAMLNTALQLRRHGA
jgi:sugar diacid utilization regulator